MATSRIGLAGAGVVVTLAGLIFFGCGRDARLAGHDLRENVTVGPVTYYGVTLDTEATPEQVAYVLLRAVREDFLAADDKERDAALDKQFGLCAANVIAKRNPTRLSRDEFLYNVVYHWTPTVDHYVHDFETEWEQARGRFVRVGPKPSQTGDSSTIECRVLMEVEDPSGDPNASAVMVIYLAQDSGYWRVLHLGFDPTRRSIAQRNVERPSSADSE